MNTNKRKPTRHVIIRYSLLQIPSLTLFVIVCFAVVKAADLPYWVLLISGGIWTAKDVILFPFVWESYDNHSTPSGYSMKGRTGRTTADISTKGYVDINGELWIAVPEDNHSPILKGTHIEVVDMKGLTLIVREDKRG